MKKLFTAILAVCGVYIAMAQNLEIEWQKSLGGSGYDAAHDIKQTIDGGYIMVGYTSSNDGDVTGYSGEENDFWIVKIDSQGDIEWQKTFAQDNEFHVDIDVARSVVQMDNEDYIIVGDGVDGRIMRLDKDGNLIWDWITDSFTFINAVEKTQDGGFVVVGSSAYFSPLNAEIIKYDINGNQEWSMELGGSENDSFEDIKETNDGGFIIAGQTASSNGDITENQGGFDWWIVKLDALGEMEWQNTYGGSDRDETRSIIVNLDGSYVVIGYTYSSDGDIIGHIGDHPDYWVVKLDDNGNIIWQNAGTGNATYRTGEQIVKTPDGGYMFTGDSGDYYVTKLNADGETEYTEAFGGYASDRAFSIQLTNDEEYILAGGSSSTNGDVTGNHGLTDFWILKLRNHITQIPDNAFEQRLIDLGLDDVLDGYVLTSNISDVTQLDVSNRNISDLTGIEDFSSLISLNCSGNQLTSLDFGDGTGGKGVNTTNDFGLEYLNASNNQLTELDVSGLSSLTTLLVNDNALTSLNVQNDNNVNFDAFSAANNPALFCIQVDDAGWSATNWTNIDPQTSFNEDCTNMSVADSQLSQLEIYPNPASNIVNFSKAIDGELFDTSGKKILTIKNASSMNVSALPKGVYLLVTSNGISRKLIIK